MLEEDKRDASKLTDSYPLNEREKKTIHHLVQHGWNTPRLLKLHSRWCVDFSQATTIHQHLASFKSLLVSRSAERFIRH